METIFNAWTASRNLFLGYFSHYSLDQLNQIPKGFNNNIIWNIGHVIVVQQSLIYKASNLPMHISDDLAGLYRPGTKPETIVSQEEAMELRALLISLIAQTKSDFKEGLFKTYNERTTKTGFHLASIGDAFEFNNYHEGLHLGYVMSIKKFV